MYKILLKFLLLTSAFHTSAQMTNQVLDSLWATADTISVDTLKIDYFYQLADSYTRHNPKNGIALLEKLKTQPYFDSSNSRGNKLDLILGILYYHNSESNKAELHLLNNYKYNSSINDQKGMATVQSKLALLYWSLGRNDESLKYNIASAGLYKTLDDTSRYIQASCMIAGVFNRLKRYEESLTKCRELLPLSKKFPRAQALLYSNISNTFGLLDNMDSTLYYAEKYKDATLLGTSLGAQSVAYYNLGVHYQKVEKLENAFMNYNKSIERAKKTGIPVLLNYPMLAKSNLLTEMNNPQLALDIYQDIDSSSLAIELLMMFHQGKYKAFKKLKEYEKAMIFLENFKTLNDSINNENIISKTNEFQIKYETSLKEGEIAELSFHKKIQDQRVFVQRIGLASLALGALLLIIFSYRLFTQKNQIKIQNKIISNSLEEKQILLKEIHHRVKNNLQLVSSLLTLQSRSIENEEAIEALNSGRNRIRSMVLIHQDLYNKENLTDIGVKNYIEKLSQELFDTYAMDKNIVQLDLNIDDIDIDIDTIIPLGLIINELITNSLKYAFPNQMSGNISIELKKDMNTITLKVKDNGIGFEPSDVKSTAFGTSLVNALTEQLEGVLNITIKDGATTTLVFNAQ